MKDYSGFKTVQEAYRGMHSINEGKVNIQVTDPEKAIKGLKKYRVSAKPGDQGDSVEVDIKDALGVIDYLIKDSGFYMKDIEVLFPELAKALLKHFR